MGKRFILEPKMAELLFVLNAASPLPVCDLDMGIALWGVHEQDHGDARQISAQYVCRARKFLGPLGVTFERVSKKGFRMLFHDMGHAE